MSEKLDDSYSPIVRDSLSWLHKGFELRIIDEKLRGIAVGHTEVGPDARVAIMAHGWVDDLEGRVISIKYGPTEEEETDVEIAARRAGPQDVARRQEPDEAGCARLRRRAEGADGKSVAVFIFVGKDGIVPPL